MPTFISVKHARRDGRTEHRVTKIGGGGKKRGDIERRMDKKCLMCAGISQRGSGIMTSMPECTVERQAKHF
jgi:hypothetical protein